jgi:uncharacterized membrane protein
MKIISTASGRAFSLLRNVRARLMRRPLLLLFILLVVGLYSLVAILRYRHFESGLDLAIFDQAVWHYSRFEAPAVSVRLNHQENLLGDHFHPIIALLAPLYWIVNRVEALLVGQALIVALSIIPIFLFTERRLGNRAAWLFTCSYSIYWGVQRTLEFEFHEVAFAVPLIAFAIYFIDLRKPKGYFACFILLLLTKENMSVQVAFFGIYLLLLKRYRDGLISFAVGVITFPLIIKVVVPFFSGRRYFYWTYDALGTDLTSALKTMLRKPGLVLSLLTSPPVKLRTLWLIFSPFLFLSLCSPILVLFIPPLAERFLSDRPVFWGTLYHYNATIAPLVALAAADGLWRLTKLLKAAPTARRAFVFVPSLAILLISLYLLMGLPLWRLTSTGFWRLNESDRDGYLALSVIPPNATVTAETCIATHLTHRRAVYIMSPTLRQPNADYIIASSHVIHYPYESFQGVEEFLAQQQEKGYVKVFERNGWVVLKNPGVLPGVSPVLLTEEGSLRAAALNAVTFMKEPFSVITPPFLGGDGHTRIALFVKNVAAEYDVEINDLEVLAEDAHGVVYELEVETAALVDGPVALTQVNVVLPDKLANAGDVWLTVRFQSMTSNKALISIQ